MAAENKKGLGITARAFLKHSGLALAAALIASIILSLLGYQRMCARELFELRQQAAVIGEMEPQTGSDLSAPDWKTMTHYQKLARAMVFFIDTDYMAVYLPEGGDPLHDEEITKRTRVLDAMDRQFVARALMGETVAEARPFELVPGEVLFVGLPLRNERDAIVGALMLLRPVDRRGSFLSLVAASMLLTGAIAVGMAFFLSRRFDRAVSRPILQITQAAQRIGEGDYGVRVEVGAKNEIGQLAKAVNTLAMRLNGTIDSLMEERDQLGIIVSSIDEGIVAVDTSGEIVRYNQAFMALMEIECLKNLKNDSEGSEQLFNLMRSCLYSRKNQRGMWTNPSGRRILALISPLLGANGEILGGVALLQDVSEAERLEQLRRDYVANVSHELRTPLTGIRGMVEPLLDGYIDTEEEKQDCYQVIYKETLHLEKLVGDMLDVSRLQNRSIQLDMERLQLRGIVEEALRRVRTEAEKAGVTLAVENCDASVACLGDESRILQVLTIFLDNALSFTPSGGTVTAYVQEEGDMLRIGVRDTGVGIEPKDLPFIWQRFYKSDKSRMRTSGTGLGLAIAKLVVELMDGEVGVDSQVGEGSDFYIRLKKE